MILDTDIISKATGCNIDNVKKNWPLVESALQEYGILDKNTAIAAACTIAVECGHSFMPIKEMGGVTYFTKLYEGRKDLGNIEKGDGAKYSGKGFVQITGRANFTSYGKQLGVNLVENPDLALQPDISSKILASYFKSRKINIAANTNDWQKVRKLVNGGLNGWDVFSKALQGFGIVV